MELPTPLSFVLLDPSSVEPYPTSQQASVLSVFLHTYSICESIALHDDGSHMAFYGILYPSGFVYLCPFVFEH